MRKVCDIANAKNQHAISVIVASYATAMWYAKKR